MREKDDTSCNDLMSQVATNGNGTSTPTKNTSQVSTLNMCILEGTHAHIARSEITTRSLQGKDLVAEVIVEVFSVTKLEKKCQKNLF
jgi:hypothetical protein